MPQDDPTEDARNQVNLLYADRTGQLDGPKYTGERVVLPSFKLEPDCVAPEAELAVCGLGLRQATALRFSPQPDGPRLHGVALIRTDDDPDKIRVNVPKDAVSGWVWADTPLGEMCSSKELTIDSGGSTQSATSETKQAGADSGGSTQSATSEKKQAGADSGGSTQSATSEKKQAGARSKQGG